MAASPVVVARTFRVLASWSAPLAAVAVGLVVQRLQRPAPEPRTMTAPNIGDLLRAWCGISWVHLDRALRLQRERPTERLGSLLVEVGAVERADLEAVLERQAQLRAGAQPKLDEALKLADYATEVLERQ